MRIVVWFSCGATSAVAAKMVVEAERASHDVRVVYIDTGSEHHDNRRFLHDVETWIDHPIEIIRSEIYRDVWDVWKRTRWLVGTQGARCTAELKKKLRHQYELPDDCQVFGFDAGEIARIKRFRKNNPEVHLETPVADHGLEKSDCLALLERAGIQPPAMYRLGFPNANCVGCVKGTQSYWNHIRRVFPETFNRMALLERELGVAINKIYTGGVRNRVFLDELDPEAGAGQPPIVAECGLLCGSVEDTISDGSGK